VLADGIHCMPVPHAQLPGPVLHVTAAAPHAALVPLARIQLDAPLDLTRARFAYAMVDLCADPTDGPVETAIVLHAADGSYVEATGRFWPAGWNRVSIDIADWAPRSAVVAIEAGIRYSGDDEPSDDAGSTSAAAPSFHLGEVGYSTLERTW
jgi:alpha-L-rhamnosidase